MTAQSLPFRNRENVPIIILTCAKNSNVCSGQWPYRRKGRTSSSSASVIEGIPEKGTFQPELEEWKFTKISRVKKIANTDTCQESNSLLESQGSCDDSMLVMRSLRLLGETEAQAAAWAEVCSSWLEFKGSKLSAVTQVIGASRIPPQEKTSM